MPTRLKFSEGMAVEAKFAYLLVRRVKVFPELSTIVLLVPEEVCGANISPASRK